jgi:hypothetical protein
LRVIRREGRRLRLAWRASLLRLPVFTQRTAVLLAGEAARPGGGATGARGSGGAAGAGAGGPPAAPPTTSPPTATTVPGPLDPVDDLLARWSSTACFLDLGPDPPGDHPGGPPYPSGC